MLNPSNQNKSPYDKGLFALMQVGPTSPMNKDKMRSMRDSQTTLIENLRVIMLDRGINLPDISRKANGEINVRHLRRFFNGEVGLTIDKLDVLARALRVTPADLMTPGLRPDSINSPEFQEVMTEWRGADDEGKALILGLLRRV